MKIGLHNIDNVFKAKQCSVETMELKGYQLVKEFFVDSSGLGLESEPALTKNQFINELTEVLKTHGVLTAKITGVGQFQVYVGLFKKVSKSIARRVANNTLEVYYPNGDIATRLHDTNIITYTNGKLILNNGGWFTRTTKDRMNQYLDGFQIMQKNYEWFVVKNGDWNNPIKYENGMDLLSI